MVLAVDGWAIAEAAGTCVSAVVLVAGAVVAYFYGRKANPSVEATAHRSRNGWPVLMVRPSITAAGVLSIKIPPARPGPLAKTRVEVAEVIGGPGELHDGTVYPGNPHLFIGGEVVGGGETVTKTELFSLPDKPMLVGWRVDFFLVVPKTMKRKGYWAWAVSTFVPVPPR